MSPKTIKIAIFSILLLVMTFIFWYQLAKLFHYSNVLLKHLISLGISYLFFLIFFLLFTILVDSRTVAYLIFLVLAGSFLLFFSFSLFYLVLVLILFLLLSITYELINLEREDRLRLSLKRIWGRGKPLIVIALSLIIAVIYYFNPLLKISQDKIEIPPHLIDFLIKPLSGMMGKMLPFYNPEMTIDELLASSAMVSESGQINLETISPELLAKINFENLQGRNISDLLKDPEIGQLLREEISKQSQKISPQLLAQQRNEFARSLGIQLTGKEKIDEIISKIINAKLGDFIGPYSQKISIGIAVLLFFLLLFVNGILLIIAMIFAQLFFLILRATGVVSVEKVMKEGEIIKI